MYSSSCFEYKDVQSTDLESNIDISFLLLVLFTWLLPKTSSIDVKNNSEDGPYNEYTYTYMEKSIFKSQNKVIFNREEISKKINRSLSAIYTKVLELQLIPDEHKGHKKLKKEQILFIVENSDKFTDSEFAAKFKISISAVEDIRKKHGIIKTGNEVSGPTYIEVFVKNFLDEINIQYLFQEKIDNLYIPDCQIYTNNKKIIIEVNGDYYHCNPYIYKDGPKDEIQIKHIIRDYYKKCYYLSRGYILLDIWESEINNCPEDVKNKIKSAVYG